jgi:hypothetical protein
MKNSLIKNNINIRKKSFLKSLQKKFGFFITLIIAFISLIFVFRLLQNADQELITAIVGIIAFLASALTIIQGSHWAFEKLRRENIIFKTTNISPTIEKENYDHCMFQGGIIIPIANPVLKGENPVEAAGPRYNIIFTVTNNKNKELLIDRIEAYLLTYDKLPEKYIVTKGHQAVLRPINLYLKLNPNQNIYELMNNSIISIESGKTEHIFRVWVCSEISGIYKFKIRIIGRIGGNKEKIIDSDKLYVYCVPGKDHKAVCFFAYRKKLSNDPIYKELNGLLDKPIDEFKNITSNWKDKKIIMPPGGIEKYYNNPKNFNLKL